MHDFKFYPKIKKIGVLDDKINLLSIAQRTQWFSYTWHISSWFKKPSFLIPVRYARVKALFLFNNYSKMFNMKMHGFNFCPKFN